MLKNYFKIAFRGFAKHKLTFFINLFGLALGLWVAMLIGLWVQDELSMNRDFKDIDQVYRVMGHQRYGDEIYTFASTPGVLAKELKEVQPEVELATTFTWMEKNLFVQEDTRVKLEGFYAEPDYLHILQYELLHGDREKILTEKSNIVLTKEAAIKLFGRTDVLGEELVMKDDTVRSFYVQAVLETLPSNSTWKFEYILPYQVTFDHPNNEWMRRWDSNGPNTLVRLRPNTNAEAFSEGIAGFVKERYENSNVTLIAYPQKELYLRGKFVDGKQQGGRIEYVRLFSIIGIFVLLIACINFMNLSTAKSQKRAKEVGVRKVVGAENSSLIFQFLSESLILTFIASLFALLLVIITMPVFNELTGKTLSIPYSEGGFWLYLLIIILFTGTVAGSYPAFYLSATKVVAVFKNNMKAGKNVVWARKGLVLAQFILATTLIVSTVVIYQQINYALQKDLGYVKEQLLTMPLEGQIGANFNAFKTRLEQHPEIKSVSRSTHNLLGRNSNTGGVSWEGKDPNFTALFEIMFVDYGFIETVGMKLVKGEDFNINKGADSLQGAIINEKAYQLITQGNPDATSFSLYDEERNITGVVADFHFQSVHENMEPVIFLLGPDYAGQGFIRLNTANIQNTLASIENIAAEINPDFPFQYSFMDDNYARMYSEDVRLRDLAKYFSILTILISCLGLLGLSAHIAEQKTKEIGIRKVLGASTLSILNVINKEFLIIVLISIAIGSGMAYWFMQDWLSGYAYSIEFEWWFIPLAAMVILSIAYMTVTLQSFRAARVNPVNSLKTE
ncbi:ABC transporter permease [Anditalea andensis]|uniref:ABC transporter permease n=1 Tax=Anditalea andensis TaxID=1048983 RepID=A0A074KXC0_9BACT|nr:ABC transporter permease [Anditalea andensis]KEO72273.1 ABC transporter permease [Anditalea andensis]